MNIFVVDQDTYKSAQALDDLRLNKMIVETAQILSTAMHLRGYAGIDRIYKPTHQNHPCCVWARESSENYKWLLLYFCDLIEVRNNRTGKRHKTEEIYNALCGGCKMMPVGQLTPFVNCSLYKNLETHLAYRLTLKEKWGKDKRAPKWTNAIKPVWA